MRLALLGLLLATPTFAQTTWYVDVSAPGPGTGTPQDPFVSVAQGLQAGVDGDSVRILPGFYIENLDLAGKALEVFADQGLGSVTINGSGGSSTVRMTNGEGPDTILRDLVITGGTGTLDAMNELRGGGLFLDQASPLLQGCRIIGNSADWGGGLWSQGGTLSLVDCDFRSNAARWGAGAGASNTRIQALGTTFENNLFASPVSGDLCGGIGLFVVGSAPNSTFVDCSWTANESLDDCRGAGAYVDAEARFLNCEFRLNVGTLQPSTDQDCMGGGLYSPSSAVYLQDCRFVSNLTGRFGGGVSGDVLAVDCEFRGNQAGVGGGAYRGRYRSCEFTNNRVTWDTAESCFGAGVSNADLEDCLIADNLANNNGSGAGAYQSALRRCQVRNNLADVAFEGFGGGLHQCTAVECEIIGNRTQGSTANGGGAYDSVLDLCVVAYNEAIGGTPFKAGGLSQCVATRCTVVGNVTNPNFPGGIAGGAQGGSISSSILWGNSPGQVDQDISSFCLIQGGGVGAGDLDLNPELWGLQSGDFHLTALSPAIDSGDPSLPPDPDGSPPDRGALPFDPTYVGAPGFYCAPKPHHIGCDPTLAVQGTPTLSGPDDFALQASNLRNSTFAMLLLATQSGSSPLGSGVLCVGGSSIRIGPFQTGGSPPGTSDCTGSVLVSMQHPDLAFLGAGAAGYAQLIIRDVGNPDGSGAAATRGVEFRVQP